MGPRRSCMSDGTVSAHVIIVSLRTRGWSEDGARSAAALTNVHLRPPAHVDRRAICACARSTMCMHASCSFFRCVFLRSKSTKPSSIEPPRTYKPMFLHMSRHRSLLLLACQSSFYGQDRKVLFTYGITFLLDSKGQFEQAS